MQVYGIGASPLYDKNIRINFGDKIMEVTKKPYVLQVSKDKEGNIIVRKKYIDNAKKRVVKKI